MNANGRHRLTVVDGGAPGPEQPGASPFEGIVGHAPAFRTMPEQVARVATAETTVLLTGESGTGKELVARAIHHASRRTGPFVAVNCAALPETVVESELFGHERGAFTGADRLKRGRFELAERGTLLLDESAELAPAVQAKLLRALEEREYGRVGGTATLRADARQARPGRSGTGRQDPRGSLLSPGGLPSGLKTWSFALTTQPRDSAIRST